MLPMWGQERGGCRLRQQLGARGARKRRREAVPCPLEVAARPRHKAGAAEHRGITEASPRTCPCHPGSYVWPSSGGSSPDLSSGKSGLHIR